MASLIDTNVIIDVLDAASTNHQRCLAALEQAKITGQVFVPDIVYAELAYAMPTKQDLDAVVATLSLRRLVCSDDGLFRAGKAFKRYREENNGPKEKVLPDFLIGAQAEAEGMTLVTSDANRMRGYFPTVHVAVP